MEHPVKDGGEEKTYSSEIPWLVSFLVALFTFVCLFFVSLSVTRKNMASSYITRFSCEHGERFSLSLGIGF